MALKITRIVSLAVISLATFLMIGCAYNLSYSLNSRDIRHSTAPSHLRVAVVPLADERDPVERSKEARKAAGGKDVGDHTSDKDFKGEVVVEISRMAAKHLQYAQCFDRVEFVPLTAADNTQADLTALRQAGFDAVLTGSLRSFCGYYDRSTGRELLWNAALPLSAGLIAGFMSVKTEEKSIGGIAPMTFTETTVDPIIPTVAVSISSLLGGLIESSADRDISWQTSFALDLIELKSGVITWSDSIVVSDSVHTSMPGIKTGKRKQEVAVASLREAVNVLVDRLAASAGTTSRPATSAAQPVGREGAEQ